MQATVPVRTGTQGSGLSTTRSALTNSARPGGPLFLTQPYESYSEANHTTWRFLYGRTRARWAMYASERFLEGMESLHLPQDRVPHLEEVNSFLESHTGFRAEAIGAVAPSYVFFDSLRNHRFPTAIGIRSAAAPESLAEHDIFHDVAGHVPLHADRMFAEALVALGECAHTAVELVCGMRDPAERLQRLTSIVKAMARFYWFTFECGLVRYGNQLRVYGSKLLSSAGEIERAIASPEVQRSDLRLDWVIHQSFEVDQYQPLLFIVESFDHLNELTANLETWMREGRLDQVSGGKPELSAADVKSFLEV